MIMKLGSCIDALPDREGNHKSKLPGIDNGALGCRIWPLLGRNTKGMLSEVCSRMNVAWMQSENNKTVLLNKT